MNYQLHHGDCLEILRALPTASVDAVVTDPPYGLSFMGKKWDYDVPSVAIWAECLRVLKPGGHLLAFAGTRTQHRMAVRIEDAGFEIRDMIAWVYGQGFPKSHNLDGKWNGWGTALKPSLEPITVARKPLIGTVAENVLAHRTGALNIDGCRVDAEQRPQIVSNRRLDHNSYGPGLGGSRSDGTTTQGRWPANLIHDGSDEVVGVFPGARSSGGGGNRRSGESMFGMGADGGRSEQYHDSGSAARFFYCAKASKRDRDEGLDGFDYRKNDFHRASSGLNQDRPGREGRKPNTDGARNHHPTVKPTALMRYLCRLVTPPGGIVLDPFMGSGSTGVAAMLEGFNFIGIEREAEYVEIAKARIEKAKVEKESTLL
jgi:DNA modification methylase